MEQKRPVEFSEIEKQKLDKYVELLLKWNRSINLIAKSAEPEIWQRHIMDSAQLIKFIKPSVSALLDVGSGAGGGLTNDGKHRLLTGSCIIFGNYTYQ